MESHGCEQDHNLLIKNCVAQMDPKDCNSTW